MHADVNAAINIRDNYITRVQQSGQAAVNQPYGWGATGKLLVINIISIDEKAAAFPAVFCHICSLQVSCFLQLLR